MRNILSGDEGSKLVKKRIVIGLVVVLVTAAAFRGITKRAFFAQASIEGAFRTLTPDESRGTVTLTARYIPPAYGFSGVKLLRHFADKIGLEVTGDARTAVYEGREELIYEKITAQAHSLVKLVQLTENGYYYLCARIVLYGDNAPWTSEFREELERIAGKMKLKEITTTLELCGQYKGEIPLAKKDELTDHLLAELYAQPVYENRENKNYTVYAYTGAVKEYKVVEGKKINVQVAIYYDREENITEVVLATPLGLR